MWCSIFTEVVKHKKIQLVSLALFGDAVPPCTAWSNTADDQTRYNSNQELLRPTATHR